jgi:hypothetical protein
MFGRRVRARGWAGPANQKADDDHGQDQPGDPGHDER